MSTLPLQSLCKNSECTLHLVMVPVGTLFYVPEGDEDKELMCNRYPVDYSDVNKGCYCEECYLKGLSDESANM